MDWYLHSTAPLVITDKRARGADGVFYSYFCGRGLELQRKKWVNN
jgi:hypothetical protein